MFLCLSRRPWVLESSIVEGGEAVSVVKGAAKKGGGTGPAPPSSSGASGTTSAAAAARAAAIAPPALFFATPRLVVQPGATAQLPVTFYTDAPCEDATATLTLRHNEAEERSAAGSRGVTNVEAVELVDLSPLVFSLTGEGAGCGGAHTCRHLLNMMALFDRAGTATEVLAMDSIVVCAPVHGAPLTRSVSVYNYARTPVTFAVTCDAPFVAGPPTILVPAAGAPVPAPAGGPHQHVSVRPGVAAYELSYVPSSTSGLLPLPADLAAAAPVPSALLAGFGSLTFTEQLTPQQLAANPPPQPRSQWYSLALLAEPPAPAEVITLSAVVRQAAVAELTLHNPRTTPLRLEVIISGAGLSGPSLITLPPQSDIVYEV
jgi:hypothetical protein